ncbi:GTP-binding protein [Parvibaculum sedimenti]|uniref:GTP-binding protein n=1 Tax=Parvibaculum sedimenti TaxID=2608632 RepID=A0A6N6VKE3_9HYPH|nr:GTP-binding protein [Parvibaculum sedimenti]KAB7741693.1 GTP-binding protein [Parvibaculum sedimenti]
MTGDAPVIVDVLTGFLGAGKTSLVRRLAEAGALSGVAVLVNEYAAPPVDQSLMGLSGLKAGTFADGCLCCATDGDLRASLLQLLENRAGGKVRPFTRILIETSGIADPASLLATLVSDPMLRPRLRLGRVVTLVDLCHAPTTLAEQQEAVAQIVAADIVLFTKADMADEGAVELACAVVGAINPIAALRECSPHDNTDPFDLHALQPRHRKAPVASAVHTHHHHIASTVLRWPSPVDWAVFASWLSLLLHRHGPNILRMKGIMTIAGEEQHGPVVIQSVRHIVHMPEHVAQPAANGGAEIVVIAREIDPALIRRSFETFLAHAERKNRSTEDHLPQINAVIA